MSSPLTPAGVGFVTLMVGWLAMVVSLVGSVVSSFRLSHPPAFFSAFLVLPVVSSFRLSYPPAFFSAYLLVFAVGPPLHFLFFPLYSSTRCLRSYVLV